MAAPTALVTGAGPVGMLAALISAQYGAISGHRSIVLIQDPVYTDAIDGLSGTTLEFLVWVGFHRHQSSLTKKVH